MKAPLNRGEMIRRARDVREATVNVALEGFTFSAEQDADFEAFVQPYALRWTEHGLSAIRSQPIADAPEHLQPA